MYSIKRLNLIKALTRILQLVLFCSVIVACTTTTYRDDAPVPDKKEAADANIALGMASLQKGDVEMAKQKLLTAVKVAPKYPASWYTLAYYYEATGDENKANQYYLHALALAPNSGDTNNNYGTFLCQNGQYQQAINRFLTAAQDPNYIDTAAAYENAGLCALRIPDLNQAKAYFSKALVEDPNRVKSLTDLAAICYKQKDYKDAYNHLHQLFALTAPTAPTLLLAAETAKQLHLNSDVENYVQQLNRNFPRAPETKKARALLK